ncbi:formate dehydrogenase accessory sulfurtransferase FdhD [Heliorestis acidaminivorans]|uniref:Sulfur carrier protein FdhD n=1 Tax=Heliorestis acidaminivorans TaxID=553427 RepID=A0A6I0F6G9_9FIRM|nr:formate dehydrogenase accessory sulfurtransferase FdhD [Heliorestis acidaminivorans]KAB2954572.1 formate dehydrogenase accessory sulfurtransferase FdhD [Heliorestis acidaminivorans]
MNKTKSYSITRLQQGGLLAEEVEDQLVREWPLTIYLNGQEIVTLLTTPEYIEDLAIGFLAAEGFIKKADQIKTLYSDEEKGQVFIEADVSKIAESTFMKRFITTGCGKGTTFYHIDDARQSQKKVTSSLQVEAKKILELMQKMQKMSQLYQETGGVHSAALCDEQDILLYREDVGRHNAVDKILGKCFTDKEPLHDKLLLTSGRISSEILTKVAKMAIPIIVSRSAPTDLAIEYAEQIGVTVLGFARGQRMNLYTHPSRIISRKEGSQEN